jgi:hypothetical protein
VEVDLEIGLPEAIKITVADWTHVQELDYEQLPFKCRYCHNYGHFTRNCKKKAEEEAKKMKGEQWMKVQNSAPSKQINKPRSKGTPPGAIVPNTVQPQGVGNPTPIQIESTLNPFDPLNSQEEPPATALDLDQQASPPALEEINSGALPTQPENQVEGSSSPSYTDMIRKKPLEMSGSSEDDTFERLVKKEGRKSLKEAREEEAERHKMQGNQPTLKMSIGRNTRARPPKGGPSSSHPSK